MVLITGANGFLGSALLRALRGKHELRGAFRSPPIDTTDRAEFEICTGLDLDDVDSFKDALNGVKVVVHCAARVHILNDKSPDPLGVYRKINNEGTKSLAILAAKAGVKRFVFISTIKVNGEITSDSNPFSPDDVVLPIDPYALSKYEAEMELRSIGKQYGMEVVIIRPPLIYGPGVKANFEILMHSLVRGLPLPLGAVSRNRRSLVYVENLVDLINVCIEHPEAAGQTFLVSDDDDLSTTDLLRRLGKALGAPARLIPVPTVLLTLVSILVGKPNIAHRLCESLQVDITKTKSLLGWRPPVSVDEGLHRTANFFLAQKR